MEVRPGYKRTDVGVIPDEWEVKPLGDIFEFSGGFTASREQLSNKGHCYLHYGDIHKSKKTFIDVQAEFLDIPKLEIPLKRVSPRSILNDGDVVFVDASEDDEGTSKHIVVIDKPAITYISGLHTIVAKSKDCSLDNRFKQFCFQTADIRRQFYFYAVGTKVSGISKTNISKLLLPIPSLSEQRAIATMLGDADTLLIALTRLIAKKRDLKQAAMQQLLTGQTRLSAFSEEWEVKRLGEVGSFSKGRGLAKKDLRSSGSLPAVPYTAIYTDHDEILQLANVRFFVNGAYGCEVISGPHLLVACSSNMLENIGKATAFTGGADIVVGGDILLYKTSADVRFLSYLLSTRPHRKRIVCLSQGSTIRHLYASTFQSYALSLPSLPEQTAIAAVLSDMDAEIAALEARLAKTHALKQGMMQELLTGRTRLVKPLQTKET